MICISLLVSHLWRLPTRSASIPPRMIFIYLPIKYVYSIYVAIAFRSTRRSLRVQVHRSHWSLVCGISFRTRKKCVCRKNNVYEDEILYNYLFISSCNSVIYNVILFKFVEMIDEFINCIFRKSC